jgi:hypothetical protein
MSDINTPEKKDPLYLADIISRITCFVWTFEKAVSIKIFALISVAFNSIT